MKNCEQCGKPFTPRDSYESKHQRFCSDECRHIAHRKRVTLTCQTCGKQFEAMRCQATWRRFCSKPCRIAAGWIPSDPAKRGVFVCQWCGKEFEEWAYRHPTFCSSQCRSEYGARQPKPAARKPEIHITLACVFCGKEYQTTTHQVRCRGSRFCSLECRNAQMSLERRGEANPHWNGGCLPATAYGPNWGRQKRRAKYRDKHACQVCGYKSGGDRILDVHHIRRLREFDGDTEQANHLDNLICLCRDCHAAVESGAVPCPSR